MEYKFCLASAENEQQLKFVGALHESQLKRCQLEKDSTAIQYLSKSTIELDDGPRWKDCQKFSFMPVS